jgi:hypothetical protein
MRETVSPEDFGATGDDTEDDTVELQAMLNSGTERVTLTAGKIYKTTSVLTVPADVFIDAAGATIHAAHNGKALTFTNGGGIRNGIITGPGGSAYVAGSMGIYCSGTSNTPAAPTYVTAPEIIGTEIKEFGEYGIHYRYVREGRIDRIYVHDCGYGGITGVSCEDITVDTPRVYDIGPGSPSDAYGIYFDRAEAGASETSDPRSYRIMIIAPDVQRVSATGGNGEGIDSHGGVDIQIIGGSITDCQKGLVFTRSTIAGVAALAPVRCKATGLSIRGGHEGAGVSISGAITGGSTIVQHATDCELNGVTVDGHGVDNTSGVGGAIIQATKNLKITGCTFKENARNGIYLNFGNLGFNISGCSFIDPHDTPYTAPACINVGGDDNRGYIGNCTYRYEDVSLAAYVSVSCVRVESGLAGLDIDFGSSTFQGIDATHLNLSLGTTTGIRYRGMMRQAGTGTVPCASGNSYDAVDITFPKRFPYVPQMVVTGDFVVAATLRPLFGIDKTSSPPTATTVRVFARPASGATFGATEGTDFTWIAE